MSETADDDGAVNVYIVNGGQFVARAESGAVFVVSMCFDESEKCKSCGATMRDHVGLFHVMIRDERMEIEVCCLMCCGFVRPHASC